jgi:hypothetical protein
MAVISELSFEDILTPDHPQQNGNDGDYEQNMDKSVHCVRCDDTQEPKDDEYDGNSIKHVFLLYRNYGS